MTTPSQYRDSKSGTAPSLQVVPSPGRRHRLSGADKQVATPCGWGRLIFSQTFPDCEGIVDALREEREDERDIALYLHDPHVVLALAPQELFLDPSHTYRLWLSHYMPGRVLPRGFRMRKLQHRSDTVAINRILLRCGMLAVNADFVWKHRNSSTLTYVVAEDPNTREVIGTVMGVDHQKAFRDPEKGSSLWCLAVDPQAQFPGIGRALIAYLADHFHTRGCSYMDLSVLHDNREAIKLYESMGFVRVPVFCVKRKNSINERLFTGPAVHSDLNPYAQIIVDEARRRGIAVKIIDAEHGYFELSHGGRAVTCRESLSELTSAIAMSRCDDKRVTRRVLTEAGLSVPAQTLAGSDADNERFLEQHGRLVVKPVSGEQGRGVEVAIDDADSLRAAIERARRLSAEVLLEEFVEGDDLRIIVINDEVVAAALRTPPEITGNGDADVGSLIKIQSRRRAAATHGESSIPVDAATESCVRKQGYELDSVLPKGESIRARETANLHTGGTIEDVTDALHPKLRAVARSAARALDIPVVGLDLIVKDVGSDHYRLIEANERPGLANHEPQPTAQRFVDFLFPQTARSS